VVEDSLLYRFIPSFPISPEFYGALLLGFLRWKGTAWLCNLTIYDTWGLESKSEAFNLLPISNQS
jgi:hypothetical protein